MAAFRAMQRFAKALVDTYWVLPVPFGKAQSLKSTKAYTETVSATLACLILR